MSPQCRQRWNVVCFESNLYVVEAAMVLHGFCTALCFLGKLFTSLTMDEVGRPFFLKAHVKKKKKKTDETLTEDVFCSRKRKLRIEMKGNVPKASFRRILTRN